MGKWVSFQHPCGGDPCGRPQAADFRCARDCAKRCRILPGDRKGRPYASFFI